MPKSDEELAQELRRLANCAPSGEKMTGGFGNITGTANDCWTRPPCTRRLPRIVDSRKVIPPSIIPSSPSEKHGWRVFGGMMGPVQ